MTCMYIIGTMNGLLLTVVLFRACLSAITSKACYGVQSPLLPCTKHTLECSSGMIAIQDAYYTNSKACTSDGLSNCNINVSSIPGTGRYLDFSETQLKRLCKNCSNQSQCTFNGGRAPNLIYFSVVKYMCISGRNTVRAICNKKLTTTTDIVSTTLPSSNSIKASSSTTDYKSTVKTTTGLVETGYTSHLTSNVHSTSAILPTLTTQGSRTDATDFPQTNTQKSSNIETIVGIVIPCLLIIIAMVLIAVFIARRKKAKTVEKNRKTNPNTQGQEVYSLAGHVHQNEYCKVEKVPGKCATVDCGYAGIENISSNPSSKDHEVYSLAGGVHRNEYFEIEPSAAKNSSDYGYAGMPNTHASTNQIGENFGTTNIQVKEDDYDHVGGKPMAQNGHYDTTASVAKTLSKLESNDKNNDENVYSYDHLNGKPTRENVNNNYNIAGRSSDYDTTASVQKRFDLATECREDDYGYNHLGNQVQKKALHNDYDTSASAVTAVARLNSRTDDPDYDHVTKDPGGAPSSYDP